MYLNFNFSEAKKKKILLLFRLLNPETINKEVSRRNKAFPKAIDHLGLVQTS